MRFLSPGFLFALLAVIIPVIIHLFNLRRFKKVHFSNVSFLKNVQVQTSSRQQLKERLILAVRILAVTFLVLAFAQPYIPDPEQGAAGRQAVSIYIDNSYSMEALNREGTLLDEAKRRAKEIAGAYSLNDKFQLLTNDFDGRSQRLLNHEEFLSAVDEVKISSAGRSLDQILLRQRDIFRTEPHARKTAYVISDFQKNIIPHATVPADSSVAVRLVRLSASPQPNISVDSVWITSAIHRPGASEQVVVRLRNNSDEEAESIPMKLMINGQQKAIGSLSLPPRSLATDTLSFSGLPAGWQRGEVQITDFPVVFDDRFYFSFLVSNERSVLVIDGKGPNEYINSVYRADEFFKLSHASAGNIPYSTLGTYPVIILSEVSEISAGLAQQLTAYVNNGGSLMIFPDLDGELAGLQSLLQQLGADTPAGVITTDTKATGIELRHPLFRGVFENIPRQMDLPQAKKYMKFNSQSRRARQNVLSFPGNNLFLAEYKSGAGTVYLSAVPLDPESNNLVRHSLFVPLMFQMAMLSGKQAALFHELNRDQTLEIPKITLNNNQVLKIKSERFEAVPDLRQLETSSQLYIADQIRQPGNYELMKNDSLLAVLSFNDSGSESDMSYASVNEVEAKLAGTKVETLSPESGSMQNAVKSINRGVSLWKFCLVMALLFLATEVFLIRYFNRTHLTTTHT